MNIKISKNPNIFYLIHSKKGPKELKLIAENLTKKHLDILFFENNTWKRLESKIDQKIFLKFRASFNLLLVSNKEELASQKAFLSVWKQYFNRNVKVIKKILEIEKRLTDTKNKKILNTDIFLVIKHDKSELGAWFSYSKNKKFIVIEIPIDHMPKNEDLFPCAILLHEFFHLLIKENKELWKTVYALRKEMPIFEELLISSFMPEGYLSQAYLGTEALKYNSEPKSLVDQRRFIANKMFDYAKNYVENNKKIDKKYLNKLMQF